MGKRRDLRSLPEVRDGLTMTDLAGHLSDRLGRPVTPQDVYAAAVKPGRVPVGRAERLIPQRPRLETVLVVSARDAATVEEAVRRLLGARDQVPLDNGAAAD